jgi:hypothetical protein
MQLMVPIVYELSLVENFFGISIYLFGKATALRDTHWGIAGLV